MKAEVITIGDEILIGQTVDTNSAWIGYELNKIGVSIDQITTIPDTKERILEALNDAGKRADFILMTGGLGPTKDDITKATLCEFFDTELVRNQEAHDRIEKYFKDRGREMLESNSMQADLPASCTVIDNFNGTASGMWFEKNRKIFVSMPGVPYEMKAMMSETVIPKLRDHFNLPHIYHRTILTVGMGESFIADKVSDWETRLRKDGLLLAYLPSPAIVRMRITSPSSDLDKLADEYAEELYKIIPDIIFGEDKDTVTAVVGRMLRERKATLATAESCTGGFMSHMITSVSGSSDYFMGAIVAYANEVKIGQLGVDAQVIKENGAVSEEVVRQMAEGVRKKLNTDYAISTSGVAGPTGGTDEKPVGTVWIAVAGPNETVAKKFKFGNNRERNILVSALNGLEMLRRVLKNY